MNRTTETLEEEITFARARCADSLRMVRMSVAHALHAVEDSIERFDGTDDLKTQAECINLAMMRICNDLLPSSASTLPPTRRQPFCMPPHGGQQHERRTHHARHRPRSG